MSMFDVTEEMRLSSKCCMYIYIYIYIYMCVCVCVRVRVCVCVLRVCMYVYMYVSVYINALNNEKQDLGLQNYQVMM